jgi:hypothetical protein
MQLRLLLTQQLLALAATIFGSAANFVKAVVRMP